MICFNPFQPPDNCCYNCLFLLYQDSGIILFPSASLSFLGKKLFFSLEVSAVDTWLVLLLSKLGVF
uniref:Uncharacterized protein n=1 Tax=Arundo donax TaxID=35708 RepID=A0A0A8YEP6_ARUDO